MKFSTMLFAAALTTAGASQAAVVQATTDPRDVDDKVDCISDFIASELDAAKHDAYIEECMQAKVAKRAGQSNKKG
ncbi:MAG: hypothetical protein R3F42_07440 [Pseudomonadota bacterium]